MYYEKVCDYCSKSGISIHEFEKKCGLGNGTVGGWKNGNNVPKLETLRKISQTTNTPIEEWIRSGAEGK